MTVSYDLDYRYICLNATLRTPPSTTQCPDLDSNTSIIHDLSTYSLLAALLNGLTMGHPRFFPALYPEFQPSTPDAIVRRQPHA
jgi:hypothetical protein